VGSPVRVKIADRDGFSAFTFVGVLSGRSVLVCPIGPVPGWAADTPKDFRRKLSTRWSWEDLGDDKVAWIRLHDEEAATQVAEWQRCQDAVCAAVGWARNMAFPDDWEGFERTVREYTDVSQTAAAMKAAVEAHPALCRTVYNRARSWAQKPAPNWAQVNELRAAEEKVRLVTAAGDWCDVIQSYRRAVRAAKAGSSVFVERVISEVEAAFDALQEIRARERAVEENELRAAQARARTFAESFGDVQCPLCGTVLDEEDVGTSSIDDGIFYVRCDCRSALDNKIPRDRLREGREGIEVFRGSYALRLGEWVGSAGPVAKALVYRRGGSWHVVGVIHGGLEGGPFRYVPEWHEPTETELYLEELLNLRKVYASRRETLQAMEMRREVFRLRLRYTRSRKTGALELQGRRGRDKYVLDRESVVPEIEGEFYVSVGRRLFRGNGFSVYTVYVELPADLATLDREIEAVRDMIRGSRQGGGR
jgi:hypothetical protein